jgi:hypothetical protein
MTEDWDGTSPFETVIKRLDECIKFALAGNNPYTQQQIINKAVTIIFKTGLYNEAVREWNKKLLPAKTYAALQTHFIEAQEQYEDEQANMQQAGFGAAVLAKAVQNVANMVVEKDGTTESTLEKMMTIITAIQKENVVLRSLVLAQKTNKYYHWWKCGRLCSSPGHRPRKLLLVTWLLLPQGPQQRKL